VAGNDPVAWNSEKCI